MDPSHLEIMIVDWVNSLDIPSCTLVDDLQDLRSGCVVADIISWLKDHPVRGIHRSIQSRSEALDNWELILNELVDLLPESAIGDPEDFLDVKSIQDDERLLSLLNFLSSVKKESKAERTVSAPTRASESSTHYPMPLRMAASPARQSPFMHDTPQRPPPEKSSYEAKPIPEALKETLIIWLEDLSMIRKGSIDSQILPSICRTGVLFCDLVNRVEGKAEVIKGIERNPRNRTQALANINKALDYLRNQPKMNARHLWGSKDVIDGDEMVIWGLLEDIRSLYVAPRITTPVPNRIPRPASNCSMEIVKHQEEVALPKSFLQEKSKALRSYSASMKRTPSQTPSLSSPRLTRPSSSKSMKPSVNVSHFYISQDMKKLTAEWICALGIDFEGTKNPYTDKLKNGVLLCEIIRLLDKEILKINPSPRSSKAIFDNFDRALSVFKKNHPEIPNTVINCPENMVENAEIVYAFIYSLMNVFPNAIPLEYQDHPLPYGALGIRKLEKSVTDWVISLNILQPSPSNFQELVPEVRSGVLLCVVVSRAFSVKVPSITRDPKTEQSAMNNIRKALDLLRKNPQMSQKYIWSAKDILKGSHGVILGIFEDIHRCADGLPARKSGEDYHKDGPYLAQGKKHIRSSSWKASCEDSFNATFGSALSPKVLSKWDKESDDVDIYAEWLGELGIHIPKSISFLEENIPEFSSGILLCNIVTALEKIYINIEKDPRAKKNAMGNIAKALSVLKKKANFPAELRSCEEDIFAGKGAVVRKLIQSLMKMYKAKAH